MTAVLTKEKIDALSDYEVIEIVEQETYDSSKLFVDHAYNTVKDRFVAAKNEMQTEEKRIADIAFYFRDRVLEILAESEDYDVEGVRDTLNEFMNDATGIMATNSRYTYYDYNGYYSHEDVDSFFIPSTC